tara:strand:+ start:35 stop:616 length:582 start_codon:yes stop_codon:yes gene_type:complete
MFSRISLYFLFSVCISYGQNDRWYKKFLSTLNNQAGVTFTAQIMQKEFELSSESIAKIEIVNKTHFIIDMNQETIFISGDTIKTYNKLTKQLIIDKIINDDIGIFSLLTGNIENIVFKKSIVSNEKIKIIFKIPELGYDGQIDILKSGEPKRMNLSYAKDQYINILINNFQTGNLTMYKNFQPNPKEIINLHE